jgi:MFS family permease
VRHQQPPFATSEALPLTEVICSLGQILGGFVTDALGWRWIYWTSLIACGVIIPIAFLVLPHAEARLPPDQVLPSSAPTSIKVLSLSQIIKGWIEKFDLLGVFTGIPGILLLNYALTSANTIGWGSGLIIGLLITSVVLLILFVLHERCATMPLINLHLFHDMTFSCNLVVAILGYGIRQGCLYFISTQLQGQSLHPVC